MESWVWKQKPRRLIAREHIRSDFSQIQLLESVLNHPTKNHFANSLAAKGLIADANANRRNPVSTDHKNKNECNALLQPMDHAKSTRLPSVWSALVNEKY